MKNNLCAALAIATVALLLSGPAAQGAEIRMLNSAAVKPAMDALLPQFEKATGHKINARYELTPAVKALADKGEPFDVVIANPPHIDDLIKQGKVAAGSRADIARFGVGVGIRPGAAKPNLATTDAFKQSLLDAKSVAYIGAGASAAFVGKLLERLGITEEMKPRLKPGGNEASLAAVAKGDIQMILMPAPLIRAYNGVELAGALPAELQDHIVLSAGVGSAATEAAAAQELVKFLMAPGATATINASGYERVKP